MAICALCSGSKIYIYFTPQGISNNIGDNFGRRYKVLCESCLGYNRIYSNFGYLCACVGTV